MSWLQRLVLRKKYVYLIHLFIVSTVVHIACISFCLIGFKSTKMHTMVVHAGALSEAPIVFLPMQKVVKDNVVKKEVAVSKVEKKVDQSIILKKEIEKKVVKAPEPKDVSPEKKIVQKKEAPKPEPKTVAQPVQKTSPSTEVVRVGRNELSEVALQRHVMEQLKKTWHPPAGVADDVSCTVYFAVNSEGKAVDVAVRNSSESTLYDIAVRSAVLRAQFPVQARKKEFTIAFKP